MENLDEGPALAPLDAAVFSCYLLDMGRDLVPRQPGYRTRNSIGLVYHVLASRNLIGSLIFQPESPRKVSKSSPVIGWGLGMRQTSSA